MEINGKNMLSDAEVMILWLLYTATVFITTILSIFSSKEFYQYWANIAQNRILLSTLDLENMESLLDCSVIQVERGYNEKQQEEIGECAICLHSLVEIGRK